MTTNGPNLRVRLGPLELRNPVMAASGTFGYGEEYADFVDVSRLGAVVVKGTTLSPWPGNPPPRVVETASGMLNAIGLQNVGVHELVRGKLPWLLDRGATVIVNVCGRRVEEYRQCCEILEEANGVAAIEVNASCPNIAAGGMHFGTSCPELGELVATCREATSRPLLVKLSPNVTDIASLARTAVDAGADVLSLVNTLLGMAIDAERQRPRLANVTGGLSGPAIKPVALRLVYQAHQAVPAPIVGMGGIMTGTDAVEFLLAGATAIAVGTASFVNPTASLDVLAGIEDYLIRHGVTDVNDLVGALEA